MTVIIILARIALPALQKAREKALQAKTAAQLASLSLAVTMFEADVGQYPNELNVGSLVYNQKAGGGAYSNWQGPYMDLKESDINSDGRIVDAWGHPFIINLGGTGGRPYDIYSVGQNGVDEQAQQGSDDVGHWMGNLK